MKALAINGSPRMKASSTWHMLKPLLAGMEAAGATTEVIHVRKLDLKPCIGCFTCWVRTPGKCIHDDAMGDTLKLVEDLQKAEHDGNRIMIVVADFEIDKNLPDSFWEKHLNVDLFIGPPPLTRPGTRHGRPCLR